MGLGIFMRGVKEKSGVEMSWVNFDTKLRGKLFILYHEACLNLCIYKPQRSIPLKVGKYITR